MRSYPALRTVAGIIKVMTIIAGFIIVIGGFLSFGNSIAIGLATLVGGAFGALLSWATAEVLLLFANMGEDIGRLVQMHEAERHQAPVPPQAPAQDAPVPALSGS